MPMAVTQEVATLAFVACHRITPTTVAEMQTMRANGVIVATWASLNAAARVVVIWVVVTRLAQRRQHQRQHQRQQARAAYRSSVAEAIGRIRPTLYIRARRRIGSKAANAQPSLHQAITARQSLGVVTTTCSGPT